MILRLIVWDVDEDTGARSIRDIKEQPVYMGDMPLMTDNGTFIINGTERVIVSQMHRSPGRVLRPRQGQDAFVAASICSPPGSSRIAAPGSISSSTARTWSTSASTASASCRSRRCCTRSKAQRPSSCAPRARPRARRVELGEIRGMDAEEILDCFYGQVVFTRTAEGLGAAVRSGCVPRHEAAGAAGRRRDRRGGGRQPTTKLTARSARKIAEKTKEVLVGRTDLLGRFVAEDLVNAETGEIYAEAGEELAEARLAALEEAGIDRLPTLAVDQSNGPWIRNTLAVDKNTNRDDALIDIYRVMRPGEPPTPETAEALFRGLFFDRDRYDLSAVGRVKMNMRLGLADVPDTMRVLRKEDILRTVKIAVRPEGRARPDRRHRQSRQPARAFGRRADGEPVPHRPAAHGAGDPRAHGLGRYRHRDAARPDQRQAGGGGGAGVLRLRRSSRSSWTRPTRCPR